MQSTHKVHAAEQASLSALVARTVEIRRNRAPRGMLPSEKLGRPAHWTTLAQRDAMTLLELRHIVVDYVAWSTPVELRIGGEAVVYHPSVGGTYAGGKELVIDLVRPAEAGTAAREELNAMLAEGLRARGAAFIAISEDKVSSDPRLPNARAVMRACGWRASPGQQERCVRLIASRGRCVTLGHLAHPPEGSAEMRGTACVLAMRRVLAIDLGAPTPDGCSVSLPVREAA